MSMTGNQNHDDGGVAPWSDLNHDLLISVMMKLGFIDIFAFSGVCKSWRSFAVSNRKMFMASKPPMPMWISKKGDYCYLKDFQGRKFKTILPQSAGRECVGLTCGGYLVLFGEKTKDFWLVNPITGHQLHFPNCHSSVIHLVRAILVFSPSIPGSVLVVINRFSKKILFSTAGTGAWNHVLSESLIHDLIAFKGKIYTLSTRLSLFEMRLNPNPSLTFLTNEYYQKPPNPTPKFASSGEKLYVTDGNFLDDPYVCQLDFGTMKWVLPEEKTISEYVFFLSKSQHGVAIKSQDNRYDCFPETNITIIDISGKGSFYSRGMWYFPHLCSDVDIVDG